MSLPAAWVDEIFTKLTLTYGRDFLGRWEGISLADVKTDWAHELAGFEAWPEAIAHVLTNLPPGRPPTVQDFRAMARKAPPPKRQVLSAPQADPERMRAELAKLAPIRDAVAGKALSYDPKAWAKRIMAQHEAGDAVRPVCLRFARDALRVHLVQEVA